MEFEEAAGRKSAEHELAWKQDIAKVSRLAYSNDFISERYSDRKSDSFPN